ncbi:MAG: hypothetical protein V4489_07225 [Chlamydiota bacterium]
MNQKKRRIFLPVAVSSLALFFILLPTLVSTEPGKKACLSLLNRFSQGKVEIKDLSLSWLGSQKIQDLHYEATKKGLNLTCQEISLEMGLLKILFFSKDLNFLQIIKPKVVVTSDYLSLPSIGKVPQEASFYPEVGSIESFQKDLHGFKGHVSLKEGSLEVKVEGSQNLIFSPIEVDASLGAKDEMSTLSLQVDSLQGDAKGYLLVKGSLDHDIALQASCSHFPLKGVDQVVGLFYPRYQGVLVALVGPSLDMDCSITSHGNLFETKVNLQSQNLKTNLQISSKEEMAELTSPAFLQITLTSESSEKLSLLFPDIPALVTSSSLNFRFNINSLHLPIAEKGLDVEKASFSSSFSSDPYFITKGMQATLKGNVSSLMLQEKVGVEVNVEVKEQKNLSLIALTGDVLAPLSDNPSVKATLTAQKTPTSLLDSFFSFAPSTFLGSWVEGTCLLQGGLHDANLSLQLTTPLFSLTDASLEWKDKKMTLLKPVTFAYRVDPVVLESLVEKDTLLLKESALATMEISRASLSKEIFLEAKIVIPTLSFNQFFILDNYELPSLEILATVDTLASIRLQAKSSIFHLESGLSLEGHKLTLTDPLKMEYTLLKQDFSVGPVAFALLDESKVKFVCNPTSVSLEGDLKKAKIQAHLDVAPLHLQNKQRGKEITLQNLSSDVNFFGAKELLDFSFSLDIPSLSTFQNSIKGSLSLQKILTYKDLSFLTMDVKIDQLSLAVLEEFYALPLELAPLIGNTISSSLHLEKTPTLQSLTLEATTPVLKAKGTVAIQEDKLFFPKNSGPFTIEYTLTPEAYKVITLKKSPFALSESTLFTASVTDLNAPYAKNTKLPDLTHTKIQATAFNEKAVFQREGSKESMVLSASKISLQKEASQKELTLGVDTKAKASSLPEGSLHLNLILSKFLNQEGAFSLADLQIGVQANATQFPSTALDIACALKKEPFAVFLGPSFEATLDLSLQNATGPVSFDLRSSKAHIDFVGKMETGSLKLVKDLKADVLLTVELGKFLLEQVNAPSIQSLFAPAPLTLTIPAQGFSFPIHSMNLSEIQIPFLRMDFGKLYCKNKGAMVSLLKQLRSKEPEGKDIQIWFAPIDLHVKQGVIDVERTEILLDKTYDIALWGEVNLPNNSVNMTLGLTAQALKQAFGIQELPDSYVLKIPIKGTLQDIKVKGSTATSKITALLLWQSKALSDAIGPFGGLLKKVIPPPGGDGKAPPPKTPYPWQESSKKR